MLKGRKDNGIMNRKGGNGYYRKRRGVKRDAENENKKELKHKDNHLDVPVEIEKEVIKNRKIEDAKEKYLKKYLSVSKGPNRSVVKGNPIVGILRKPCKDDYTGVSIGKGQCVLFWMTDTYLCKVVTNDGREAFVDGADIKRMSFVKD